MTINEMGLLKAMKRDWREGGYTVAGMPEGICILGIGWGVALATEMIPRKVLGLIVEHAGTIPTAGKAFRLDKPGRVQEELYATAMESMTSVNPAGEPELEAILGTFGGAYCNGGMLWQRDGYGAVFLRSSGAGESTLLRQMEQMQMVEG